jgi:hypothetical protein
MSKHTPGPWSVGPWFDNYGEPEIIIEHKADAGNLVIAVALGGLVGQEANARLIAAAPDLLEALNAMLTHMGMDEDEWNKPTFDQARAAIAKAIGEQS